MQFLQYHLDLQPQSRWNMVNATAAAKNGLIYAQEIGNFYAGADYFTTREGFPSYLLKLTVDGGGILEYNGQRCSVGPGHFFWIDCTRRQHYYTDPQYGHWHVLWVHLYGANAKTYYDAFLSSNNGSPTALCPMHLPMQTLLESLLDLDNSGSNQLAIDFQISGLLAQLLSCGVIATASTHQQSNDVPQIIQSVRLYLQSHFTEKHTLAELGSMFNINPFYLQKQFKRYIGQSPTEFQIFLRASRAKELMRTTRLPIGEIAYAVGIENMGYFTRLFKQLEGMTPQEYRKLWPVVGIDKTGDR